MIARSRGIRAYSRLILGLFLMAVFGLAHMPQLEAQTVAPAQTCGNHNIRGGPVAGTFLRRHEWCGAVQPGCDLQMQQCQRRQ